MLYINSESNNVKAQLINMETGELINIYENDNIKITRESQKNAIGKALKKQEADANMQGWNKELGGFVFALFRYCDNMLEEHPDIVMEDIIKLFYISTYINYEGYAIDEDGSIIDRNKLRELLKMGVSQFDIFFNKMINNQIFIYNNADKVIQINKNYFLKGSIDSEIRSQFNYTRVYINTIRFLYENTPARKHRQLGNYFKMIPFVHRQRNVLCWNPDANNKEDLHLLTLADLKDILGYHRTSVKPFIRTLLSTKLNNGEPIIAFFVTDPDFWRSVIIVNPRVFYGGNFDIDEGQRGVLKWLQTVERSTSAKDGNARSL